MTEPHYGDVEPESNRAVEPAQRRTGDGSQREQACGFALDPADGDATALDEPWHCPHERYDEGADRCLFHMDEAERAERGVDADAVGQALVECVKRGSVREREFVGATLPGLHLDYHDVEGVDQHPIDLRHATIEGEFRAEHARFEECLDLRRASVAALNLDDATFEDGLDCAGATITGRTVLEEAVVTGADADFTRTRFGGPVEARAVTFRDDASFESARFDDDASFDGAEFHEHSATRGDVRTFDDAEFRADASFVGATFGSSSFERVAVAGVATFDGATFDGVVRFSCASFDGPVSVEEAAFADDATFEDARFEDGVTFAGSEFSGGATLLADDCSFENAAFGADARFERCRFATASFELATFEGDAVFEGSTVVDDCRFRAATFQAVADFDEVTFDGDADFEDAVFHDRAAFRGSQFRGRTNHLEDDVHFHGAVFLDDADFRNAHLAAADFTDSDFEGDADFTDATVEEIDLRVSSFAEDTYFDFTEARIDDGEIVEPVDGWIRYDLTEATLGEVTLDAADPEDRRTLLDYFRFCDTDFDGFDFSDHTDYLDRNDWTLHRFDVGDADREFDVEQTPERVEKTYLAAKSAASANSNVKAAGEFRVKRQRHARRKYWSILRDSTESGAARFANGLRAVENLFLGVSCGYGLRLYRITGVFLLVPFLAAFLFAFGGPAFETGAPQLASTAELATVDGLRDFGLNVYFSYITFLTIGYGNIGPDGFGARFLAAGLVYLNVILAGLFLYALIKRSEI